MMLLSMDWRVVSLAPIRPLQFISAVFWGKSWNDGTVNTKEGTVNRGRDQIFSTHLLGCVEQAQVYPPFRQ